ncbi:hypothetical protein Aph01nite_44010 [Acrocarpospora phusangensis]|uniref:Uncharacterized protein n=1 Tax=Acrocarpospora phusangensis TaxID=1070424 RepID=A0A919QDS6_9ACTN|nr:hypothetical protein [Acrocarpospora phusangensis]GIH26091.1 hypothetical protein Aph01nite_44010 [Acrocarpospora phusangensis]
MADSEFPADLIAAQRAFMEADRRVQEVDADWPLPTAVAAGEAVITTEQHEALDTARRVRLDALDAVRLHPFWGTEPGGWIHRKDALRRAASGSA